MFFISTERELCKIMENTGMRSNEYKPPRRTWTGQGRTGSQQKRTAEACPQGAER